MTTCPSGVHYMHLVDHGRAYIEHTYTRPPADRALRAILAFVLPYPARFRLALRLSRLGKPFMPLLQAFGFDRLAAMLRLAPASLPRAAPSGRRVYPATGPRRGRVLLMRGCANEAMAPETNAAAIRLLTRHGVEVVLAADEGCCGALVHHLGREETSLAQARNNVDAWTREIDTEDLDAILVTASGCGTSVKDYGFMLRTDAAYAEKAARVSALAKDISEYVAGLDLKAAVPTGLTIAYHSACSLQHGQKVTREPKELLARVGFVVKDVPEGHLCCGSAGTYNMLQPDIARRLAARKAANIESLAPDVIATGNLGCMVQIGSATAIPAVHTVELLDWATGGPAPKGLQAPRARDHMAQTTTHNDARISVE